MCILNGVTKVPPVELAALKKLSPGELRLLWVNDGYDGPLEAVVEHENARCLMVLLDEDARSDHPYRWLIIQLSAEQSADLEAWHVLFVKHVGDHWCFHGATLEHAGPPSEPHPERFDEPFRERPPLDLSANTVVGWTDEMPAL